MDADLVRVHKVTLSDLRPFQCDKCPYAAKLKKQFNKHLRIHEEGREQKHVCDVCGFQALREEQLKNHIGTHTGERLINVSCVTMLVLGNGC